MFLRTYVVLITTVLALAGCDQMQGLNIADNTTENASEEASTDAASMPGSKILATVNGAHINQEAFDVYSQQRKPKPGGAKGNNREAILNEIINLELMRQEAITRGFDKNPDAIAMMDYQRRAIMAGAVIKAFLKDNEISEETLQQFYNEQIGEGNTEFNAKHILLENEDDATQVILMLDNGSDFGELAKEKSTGPSASSGGELGWFAAGQMVKPFSDAAAALEKDSYTKEPVKTRFGWHVIYLVDTRKSTPPPFNDVKDRLRIVMKNQALQEHLQTVKDASSIQIMKMEEPAEEPADASPVTDEQPTPDTETDTSAETTDNSVEDEESSDKSAEPASE